MVASHILKLEKKHMFGLILAGVSLAVTLGYGVKTSYEPKKEISGSYKVEIPAVAETNQVVDELDLDDDITDEVTAAR